MEKTAAIIGGGIGGLATAIALRTAGWSVEVFERGSGLPTTGTALGLWPSALAALDTLGVGAEVRSLGRRQHAGAILRPDGRRIATMDMTALSRLAGDSVYLLSRPPLLRLLAGALDPDTVRFGVDVPDVRALTGYSVVIAADGINSRARTTLFGERYGTRYVGATAWRGTVDGDTDTFTETWGGLARFGVTPQESGRTNWYACLVTPPGGHAPDGEATELRRIFGGWHAEVRRVLGGLREDTILRHDLHDLMRPPPAYVAGRVALIGDA